MYIGYEVSPFGSRFWRLCLMSSKHRYLIIGCGAAGSHAAFQMREMDPTASVTVVSQDSYPVYHKYDLTHYLSGKIKKEALFHDYTDRFVQKHIHLRLSQRVVSIDVTQRSIRLDHREDVPYDKLLLAMGVRGCVHPTYEKFQSYFTLINHLDDIEKLRIHPEKLIRPLILGGSLTGIRLALALKSLGKPVDYLMFKKMTGNLLAGADDFDSVRRLLSCRGIDLMEDIQIATIKQEDTGYRVTFSNEMSNAYSIVFAAFGVKPNIGIAKAAGIACELGVLVNPYFETDRPHIYAAGDIAQIYNPAIRDYWVNFGWPNAVEQGITAARNMCGERVAYDPNAVNILAIGGVKIKFRNWQ
jgi:nitrite reductase (NADH) large subunit